jgi:EF hand
MVETTKDILSRISMSLALTALAALSMPMTAGAIPPMMRERFVASFQEADLDEDGQLTRFEVKAAGLPDPIFRNFRRIDTDKSGTITLRETVIALNRGVIILRASSIDPATRNIANRQAQLYGSQPQNY